MSPASYNPQAIPPQRDSTPNGVAAYRMPAEWEEHEATWLAWPHYKKHWPGKFEPIPFVYAEIIRALLPSEKVFVCVNDAATEESARNILKKSNVSFAESQLKFFHIPTNASWSRDHGPIFVRNQKSELVITDWIYNAWGNQWPCKKDDLVPQKIGELLHLSVIEPGMVFEGGSVDVNGKGSLLTTEQCLLNKNRNPSFTRDKIEQYLHDFLGATNILWAKGEILGDDTSGHIDDIARFVDENTVVCAREKNTADENYEMLERNFRDLQYMKDQNGKVLRVLPLPMPTPVVYKNRRLPASYANFYIANSAILVPTFRCKKDVEVIRLFKELFLKRDIIGIDCVDLVWGFGAIHCSTQQQPKA